MFEYFYFYNTRKYPLFESGFLVQLPTEEKSRAEHFGLLYLKGST